VWLTLIAAESAGGQGEKAQADLRQYLAKEGAWRILAAVRGTSPFYADIPNLLEGLRKAGMPEE
jgi:hypothetical protein